MISKPLDDLKEMANKLRRHVLVATTTAKSGHPGGSLSAADIVTTLYFKKMKHDPKNPKWDERDRLIVSKGHCAPVIYAAMAESGYFPIEELKNLRKYGSKLQGHVNKHFLPSIEVSTGSLGHGLSIGIGMALSARLDKKTHRVYILMGDGECDEGEVWEAAMFAAHHKVDNITAIIDRNKLQLDACTEDIVSLEPFAEKWKAFGWNVIEINGHNFEEIMNALDEAEKIKGKPTVIIANTIKGKGVSFMEGKVQYHGAPLKPEELEKALVELNGH